MDVTKMERIQPLGPIKLAVTVVLSLGIGLSLWGALGLRAEAQAPTPPSSVKYEPTEVERLRLEVKQKDAQLAQVQLQRAQQAFQQSLALLDEEAGKVKVAHPDWPKGVQFSPDTLTFTGPSAESKKP